VAEPKTVISIWSLEENLPLRHQGCELVEVEADYLEEVLEGGA